MTHEVANTKTKTQSQRTKAVPAKSSKEPKGINHYWSEYQAVFPSSTDKLVSGVGMVLTLLAFMGITWSLPFPKLHFLGQYATYFNWASFLIAFYVAYYYFKLAPLYSYVILLVLFGLSYVITELDQAHQHGGPSVWPISFVLLVIGVGVLVLFKKSGSIVQALKFILVGPACIFKLLLKR
jgi:hypothetical protein